MRYLKNPARRVAPLKYDSSAVARENSSMSIAVSIRNSRIFRSAASVSAANATSDLWRIVKTCSRGIRFVKYTLSLFSSKIRKKRRAFG